MDGCDLEIAGVDMGIARAAVEDTEDMLREQAEVSTILVELSIIQPALSMEPLVAVMVGTLLGALSAGAAAAVAAASSVMVVTSGDTEDMLMERAASVAVSTIAEAEEAMGEESPKEPPVVFMEGAVAQPRRLRPWYRRFLWRWRWRWRSDRRR